MPTTMFSNTPLNCTICTKSAGNCGFMIDKNGTYKEGFYPVDPEKNVYDPAYNAGWVTKHCTMTEIDNFILYFPYVLLLIPLIMVGMESGFIR